MNRTAARLTAATAAMLLFAGPAASAVAAPTEQDTGDVTVTVEVPQIHTPGVLAMTVAANTTTLAEHGSDNTARTFTGTLPTVTVTDTRDPAEVPAGAYWSVLGSASDLVSAAGTIKAENLGWAPRLIDGGASGNVAEGDAVDPKLDGGPGLVDRELLAMANDSGAIATEGTWTASADLTLKTPVDVKAGTYTGTLTLSLFE